MPKYVGCLPHKALCRVTKDPFTPAAAAAARNKLHIICMYTRYIHMYVNTSCLYLTSINTIRCYNLNINHSVHYRHSAVCLAYLISILWKQQFMSQRLSAYTPRQISGIPLMSSLRHNNMATEVFGDCAFPLSVLFTVFSRQVTNTFCSESK